MVLTQTHPAAPYVCRTGNITLRCQYDGVENVLAVVWVIGGQTTTDPSTIPGHTALPLTTTYQELVVDSYTNLRERYQCSPVLINGSALDSNVYGPQIECKHNLITAVPMIKLQLRALVPMYCVHVMVYIMYIIHGLSVVAIYYLLYSGVAFSMWWIILVVSFSLMYM